MPNAVRRWSPLILIALTFGASVVAYTKLPPNVRLDLRGLFPFDVPISEPANRWFVTFVAPVLSLVVWMGFRAAPTASGHRFARRFFLKGVPDEVLAPAQFDRFAATYDAIVLGVIVLILGVHGALLSAALGYPAVAARALAFILGLFLISAGNVMPRLRPNWVAGLRTKRTLSDAQLWRSAHLAFGTAFVVSGIITIVVSLAAPRYGLLTALALLCLSLVVGFVASTRGSSPVVHAVLVACLLLPAAGRVTRAQRAGLPAPVVIAPPSVTEQPFQFVRDGLTLDGTLPTPRAGSECAKWRCTAILQSRLPARRSNSCQMDQCREK